MNPLHLLWIVPLALVVGYIIGVETEAFGR